MLRQNHIFSPVPVVAADQTIFNNAEFLWPIDANEELWTPNSRARATNHIIITSAPPRAPPLRRIILSWRSANCAEINCGFINLQCQLITILTANYLIVGGLRWLLFIIHCLISRQSTAALLSLSTTSNISHVSNWFISELIQGEAEVRKMEPKPSSCTWVTNW